MQFIYTRVPEDQLRPPFLKNILTYLLKEVLGLNKVKKTHQKNRRPSSMLYSFAILGIVERSTFHSDDNFKTFWKQAMYYSQQIYPPPPPN